MAPLVVPAVMQILAPGPYSAAPVCAAPLRTRRGGGFTLIELLITLVVIGVAVALVGLNGMPNERQGLRFEAERLAQLLSLAHEEAQVRGVPIRLMPDSAGYRFEIRRDRQWVPLLDDADLRQREWQSPTTLTLRRADGRAELAFGRDPVDSPFVLSLVRQSASVELAGNGLGRFEVLP